MWSAVPSAPVASSAGVGRIVERLVEDCKGVAPLAVFLVAVHRVEPQEIRPMCQLQVSLITLLIFYEFLFLVFVMLLLDVRVDSKIDLGKKDVLHKEMENA